ncbi:MAG: hypothetical protein IKS12_05500, partial [Eubacterium sp.]|nr:hypothetical protein [Eubacterium sp.]
MEYAFAFLTFTFGGGLLLYALALSGGNYNNLLRNWATNPPDKKKYAKEFSKILALIALAPIISGAVSLFVKSTAICVIILAVLMILFIILGVQ